MNESASAFGPFDPAFTADGLSVPGYLELLNLRREEQRGIQTVIDRIEQALTGAEADRWVGVLMAELGWRPHLVGAVAFLLDRPGRFNRSAIWKAIDRGSWVIPQLAVTAFFADPSFARRARSRLNAKCPLHSVPGRPPGPGDARSAKMAASLLALVPDDWELAPSGPQWRSDPELIALLETDARQDRSDTIVGSWTSRIRECFDERGIRLVPAR